MAAIFQANAIFLIILLVVQKKKTNFAKITILIE